MKKRTLKNKIIQAGVLLGLSFIILQGTVSCNDNGEKGKLLQELKSSEAFARELAVVRLGELKVTSAVEPLINMGTDEFFVLCIFLHRNNKGILWRESWRRHLSSTHALFYTSTIPFGRCMEKHWGQKHWGQVFICRLIFRMQNQVNYSYSRFTRSTRSLTSSRSLITYLSRMSLG